MKSLLHSLNDSESVLLMYLFDELPEDDQAEVESMLNTDAGLRTRLEQLRAVHDRTSELLADADRSADKRMHAVHSAERNAIKLLNQWTVRKTIDRPAPREVSPIRKYVLYPAISAAAVMMIGLILWGIFGPVPTPILTAAAPESGSPEEQLVVAEIQRSLQAEEPHDEPLSPTIDVAGEEMLVNSLDSSEEVIREAMQHQHINDAESQISVISRLTEDADFQ